MNYDEIIVRIKQECENKDISIYELSQISKIPASTLYGVLRQSHRAQVDTLCEILKALNLSLIIQPLALEDNFSEDQYCKNALMEGMALEKQEVVCKLIDWLKE